MGLEIHRPRLSSLGGGCFLEMAGSRLGGGIEVSAGKSLLARNIRKYSGIFLRDVLRSTLEMYTRSSHSYDM